MKVLGIDFGTTTFSYIYDTETRQSVYMYICNSSYKASRLRREFDVKEAEANFQEFVQVLSG